MAMKQFILPGGKYTSEIIVMTEDFIKTTGFYFDTDNHLRHREDGTFQTKTVYCAQPGALLSTTVGSI